MSDMTTSDDLTASAERDTTNPASAATASTEPRTSRPASLSCDVRHKLMVSRVVSTGVTTPDKKLTTCPEAGPCPTNRLASTICIWYPRGHTVNDGVPQTVSQSQSLAGSPHTAARS